MSTITSNRSVSRYSRFGVPNNGISALALDRKFRLLHIGGVSPQLEFWSISDSPWHALSEFYREHYQGLCQETNDLDLHNLDRRSGDKLTCRQELPRKPIRMIPDVPDKNAHSTICAHSQNSCSLSIASTQTDQQYNQLSPKNAQEIQGYTLSCDDSSKVVTAVGDASPVNGAFRFPDYTARMAVLLCQ